MRLGYDGLIYINEEFIIPDSHVKKVTRKRTERKKVREKGIERNL